MRHFTEGGQGQVSAQQRKPQLQLDETCGFGFTKDPCKCANVLLLIPDARQLCLILPGFCFALPGAQVHASRDSISTHLSTCGTELD